MRKVVKVLRKYMRNCDKSYNLFCGVRHDPMGWVSISKTQPSCTLSWHSPLLTYRREVDWSSPAAGQGTG